MVKRTTAKKPTSKKAGKEKVSLQAEKRKILGRKVKKLRQEEILPANIYGKKVKSLAVQVDLQSFLPVFKQVGETGLVELKVKGEKKLRSVLIHNVQMHPVSDHPLHADFYQVDLRQKVTTEIPIELVSESPAVEEKGGVLIQPLSEVEVEALPANLPDKFEVNVGKLKEIGDMALVGELKVPEGVKILTSAKQVLVKIEPPTKEEEVTPPPEKEAPDGEVPEGKRPAEEKPAEEKAKASPEGKPEEAKAPSKEEKPAGMPSKPARGEPAETKVEKKEKGK